MIADALEGSHRVKSAPVAEIAGTLRLRCPVCARGIRPAAQGGMAARPSCASCGFKFESEHGIWKALSPAREEQLRPCLTEHSRTGTAGEGGAACAYYYLALPYDDSTGRNSRRWKIRARSYRFLQDKILPVLEQSYPGGMDILDAGAGNCWMSYRLSLRGHRPTALDVCADDSEGLGAARHFLNYVSQPFPRFQGEMNRLPFDGSQFDAVIFNASFHFSDDYQRTLEEALRCLRLPGHLFIIDSPFCRGETRRRAAAGQGADLDSHSNLQPESSSMCGFLTPQVMDQLAARNHLAWRRLNPWRGARWALRPLKACLLRRGAPPGLFIFWAAVGAA